VKAAVIHLVQRLVSWSSSNTCFELLSSSSFQVLNSPRNSSRVARISNPLPASPENSFWISLLFDIIIKTKDTKSQTSSSTTISAVVIRQVGAYSYPPLFPSLSGSNCRQALTANTTVFCSVVDCTLLRCHPFRNKWWRSVLH
jgi:hypothetical protein